MKPFLMLALALTVACGDDDKPAAPAAKAPGAKPAPVPAPAPAPSADGAAPAGAAPAVAADGAAPAGAPEAPAAPPAANGVDGKAVYMQYCVACHGADGKGNGGLAASFIDEPARLAKPDAELIKSVKEGKQGSVGMMPPWGGTLNDGQISAVVAYIRADFGA
jgi:mono/diheme cytochrome c family protein